MAKILKNKKAYQEVSVQVLQNTLDYVTLKYGLTSDYVMTGFKLSKNGIEIKVKNNEVECIYLITSRVVIDSLTEAEEYDNLDD